MDEVSPGAFLVVADSPKARETVRNVCKTHEDTVVRRFGRAILLEPTEFGAFLAFWLRQKHGDAVTVRATRPVDERRRRYRRASDAALAFANREHERTPYPKFAAGTEHPRPAEMRERTVGPDGSREEATGD